MLELLSTILLIGGLVAFALRLGWFTWRKVTGGGDIANATASIQSQTSAFIDEIIVTAERFVGAVRTRELAFFEASEEEIGKRIADELVAAIGVPIRTYLDRLNAILSAEKLPKLNGKESEKISELLLGKQLNISVTYDDNDEAEVTIRAMRGFLSVLLFGIVGILGFIGIKSREERLREQYVEQLEAWLGELKRDRLVKIQAVSNRVLSRSRLKLMQDLGDLSRVFTAAELSDALSGQPGAAVPGSPEYRLALTAAVEGMRR